MKPYDVPLPLSDIEFIDMDECSLMRDLLTEREIKVNQTARVMLSRFDGIKSIAMLSEEISTQWNIDSLTVQKHLLDLCKMLRKARLVYIADSMQTRYLRVLNRIAKR